MTTAYFDIWPKVVPADQQSTIRITPLYQHCTFNDSDNLSIHYVRDDGKLLEAGYAGWAAFSTVQPTLRNGTLEITLLFAGEFEHTLKVMRQTEQGEEELAVFYIYSLAHDLLKLRPYKGDFHLHSFHSDGKESPAYVAASCRRIGLDFMALTDHYRYAPSLEAIAAMAELETDLKCYPGEEIHPPDNPVHIVNFGGNFSVNDWISEHQPTYSQKVTQKAQAQALSVTEQHNAYQIASSEWVFDKIREGNGIAMYCHPYWRPDHRYYVNQEVNDQLLTRQHFDVLEIIGGFYRYEMESNALAVARYHERQAQGQLIPVAGVSDSHGCDGDLFGWYYTIILAQSDKFDDLATGIKSLHSVAVEAVPGEFPRVTGPFRLVKFVYFLLREFYPVHDELCQEEGKLMLAHLAGDQTAKAQLAKLKGRVPALLAKYWQA